MCIFYGYTIGKWIHSNLANFASYGEASIADVKQIEYLTRSLYEGEDLTWREYQEIEQQIVNIALDRIPEHRRAVSASVYGCLASLVLVISLFGILKNSQTKAVERKDSSQF